MGKSPEYSFLLSSLLGFTGAHRFYLGKYYTGILMLALFIFGISNSIAIAVCGIWWIIDTIIIGLSLFKDSTGAIISFEHYVTEKLEPAGVLLRICAHIIDSFITCLLIIIFTTVIAKIDFSAPINWNHLQQLVTNPPPIVVIINCLILFTYYTFFHCFRYGATPGKRLVWIYVATPDSYIISRQASSLRTISFAFSYLTLGLGFLLAIFTPKHRALHDYIAGTVVFRGRLG